jgi:hypothetical protein
MSNIVTPLKTPWMLSTTERELNLEENGSELNVVFLGFFGNFMPDEEKYKDVSIVFSGVQDFRYFPEYSEDDSNRIDEYDWEELPEFRDDQGSLANHRKVFDNVWKQTSTCPNPSVYEVKESSWVSEGQLKHYLILAGDYNLEVLAESCSADL